ncbi:MAG: ACT domain-containing protein [Phycisphaerae bacterium]|nr:ACT domain-containing protein [Phycisphaerae bacterium]
MWIATQFSVFMVNRPGVLAQVLGELARAKVNLLAMTMVDSSEHGVMRVVFEQTDRARAVLKGLNMSFDETDVLCVSLENRSGALAGVMEKLAKNHINVTYAYCTAGARGGRTTGVIKVAEIGKAMGVLGPGRRRQGKTASAIRRPRSQRR